MWRLTCQPELDLKLHGLLHLVDKIVLTGQLWVTSMFVYESMWGQFGRWSRNQCHVELSMFRSFLSFEMAYHAFWKSPGTFSFKELSRLSETLDTLASLYQVQRVLSTEIWHTVVFHGMGRVKRGDSIQRALFLRYCMAYGPISLSESWQMFTQDCYSKNKHGVIKSGRPAVIQYSSAAGMGNAAAHWLSFLRETGVQDVTVLGVATRLASLYFQVYKTASLDKKTVVCSTSRQACKHSWVLLQHYAQQGLYIGRVIKIMEFSLLEDIGLQPKVVEVEIYESKDPASGRPEMDEVSGAPIFCDTPQVVDYGLTTALVPMLSISGMHITVLKHPEMEDKLVLLARNMQEVFKEAGCYFH